MNPENHQKKLFQEFESADLETWKEAALKMLKGKALETLQHLSYENIEIAPIYTADQGIEATSLPAPPQTWSNQIEFKVFHNQESKLNALALTAIQNGADAIIFHLLGYEEIDFKTLLHQIPTEQIEVSFAFIPDNIKYADALKALDFQGNVQFDILSHWIFTGEQEDANWDKLSKIVQDYDQNDTKSIAIDTDAFHQQEISVIQELAIALALAVEYIDQLNQKGITIEKILPKIFFTLYISGDYFMEIAKLRAMRSLWAQIIRAYNVDQVSCFIRARTGRWNKFTEDIHTNILRSTTEALSAVVGNCDQVTVGGFDEPLEGSHKQEIAGRIARNISNILKQESHLDKIIDPGHGSYYIEYLTQKVAKKAWELFQEIEQKGGFIRAYKQGFIQQFMNEVSQQRKQDFESGKAVFVGVNKYQNPKDEA